MSDQVKQQVMVEFIGALLPSLEKSFKEVIDSIKALGSAHKQANADIEKTNKVLKKNELQGKNIASQTEKASQTQSKFHKVLKEMGADYKRNEAGLTSVAAAFGHYARGVTSGNKSINVAQRNTEKYMAALMGTNSVLMAADRSWGSWAKTVRFKTIRDAEANGQIKLTREGIQLLNAESWKAIGLSKDQAKAVQASSLAQDAYSKKLREAKIIGGDYLKSFETLAKAKGTTDKSFHTWSRALDQANKGLNNLRTTADSSGGAIGKVALGVGRTSIAMQIMDKNLQVSNGSFKIFNETGLKSLGITVDQAAKMKMLASTYGAYGTTLQKMHASNDANLKSFTELTKTYGKGDASVKLINKALLEADKIISSKVLVHQNKLNEAVAAGTMTRTQANASLAQYKESLNKVGIASEIVNKTQADIAYGARRFGADMAEAIKHGEKYQAALKYGKGEYGEGTKAYKDYEAALRATERTIVATGKAMNAAGKNGDAFVETANRQKLAVGLLDRKYTNLNGTLGNSYKFLKPITTESTGLALALEKLGTSMMNVAKYAVGAFAFYGVVSTVSAVVTQIMNYDQALKDLQAITTATDYQTILFGETIKDVSRETKFSASEVADGMKNLGQAGFSAAETIVVIGDAAMLATGTLSDMETVVDLMTTTIRAYHLEASESGRLTDLFANAINRSKLTVDKLRVAFNYLASVADKANISVDDSVTLMGLLANAGVRASTIGTSLRQIIEGLVSPNKKFEDAVKSAGYTVDQFVVNDANPLEDVIRRLQKVVPDAAAAFELFGIRGAPAISAITAHGVEGFLKMKQSMQEAGSASAMAEIQMEGLANKAKNMKDRFELVSIALGDAGVKYFMEAVIELGRNFATLLEGVLSSSIGKVVLALGGLAAATAAVNLGVSTFMGLAWVQSLKAAGAAAITASGGVATLTGAVTLLRTSLMSLIASPVGIAAIGIALVAAGMAYSKYVKEQKNYLAVAEKAKSSLDREIRLSDKKKNATNALISTITDSTKTEQQRALALDRLIGLGVQVEGVIRNEEGAIINLDEALKKAVPSAQAYTKELEKMREQMNAEKILADLDAFMSADKAFNDAFVEKKKVESLQDLMGGAFGAGIPDPLGILKGMDESNEKLKYTENILEATKQKVDEQIAAWSALTKETYSARLQASGMGKEEADSIAKNFNSLDSKFVEFWFNQFKHIEGFEKKYKDSVQELMRLLDQAQQAYQNSPETRLKELQQAAQVKINDIKNSLPNLDAPEAPKNIQAYTEYLKQYKDQADKVKEANDELIKGTKDLATSGLAAEVVDDTVKAAEESTKNFSKNMIADKTKVVDAIINLQELETEAQKIGLDNRAAALEMANARNIGNEHDTANAILDIRRQQYAIELKGKREQLALLEENTPNEVEKVMKIRNEIASIEVDMASVTADKIANIEAKKAEERERAEQTRAFNHNMALLEIDQTYWEDKNLKGRETNKEVIAYLDSEMSILQSHIEEKKKKGQEVFDEEQKLRDLTLERTQALYDQQTQAKVAQKELEDQIETIKVDNVTAKAEEDGNYELQLEALAMKHAMERQQWEEHYQNLLDDKTLYNQLMYQLDMKHQRERDALIRAQQSAEYAKKAEFFGELSGMMGEFYAISNEKAVAFFYAQKALAVAEILMNTHAGAAKAIGYGPFGIPMSAMITAMGYAKAGMVMGLTVAQGVKGFADGGEIGGYSPNDRADNVPIMATAGEFMQPVASVDYYGKGVMEAIRTRSIPREVLSTYSKPGSKSGGSRFAEGGGVDAPSGAPVDDKEASNLQIVNVLDPGMFDQYMASHAGQKTLMNVISRNPQVIKNIVRN